MSHPAPVPLDHLPCPACGTTLHDDSDGTRCPQCDGLLVHRTWAVRVAPELGRPALQPALVVDGRVRGCPMCRRTMGPVLCHGVLAWSCARCRWLFFDGPKHHALTDKKPVTGPLPQRSLTAPSMLQVIAERAQTQVGHGKDALAVVLLAAVVLIAIFVEMRPG